MPPTIRVVIQARVGSMRLPGKILMPLADRPLLEHVVRRMRLAGMRTLRGFQVMVATTTAAADDVTAALCDRLCVPCFRGANDDVLARYVAATADLDDDATVVRATADNPLYCPRRTVTIVERHVRENADYTFIDGLSYVVPEVIRVSALRRAGRCAEEAYDREHVTPYLRADGTEFRVVQLPGTWQGLRADIPLTVDTQEQYARMAGIFEALIAANHTRSLEEVYAFCDARADRSTDALPSGMLEDRAA